MRRLGYFITFVVLALGLCGLWPAGPAYAQGDPVIYATSAGPGEATLYSIDPDTGEVTEIGDTGFNRISALELDSEGTLWGIGENSDGDSVLITISIATGEGTEVGTTGIEESAGVADAVPGCSLDGDENLYAFAEDGNLFTVDTTDGDATLVGYDSDAEGEVGNALGFDGDDTLWHVMSESLYTVDTTDGAHTYEDDLTVDNPDDPNDFYDWTRSMDWWDDASAFYAIVAMFDDSAGDDVYYLALIDPVAASVELIGETGNLGSIAVADESVLGVEPQITEGPAGTPVKVSLASGEIAFSVTATDGDGDDLTYAWDFGDGTPTSSVEDPSHTYTASGVYTAEVVVSDDTWLVSDTVEVTVNTPPAIDSGPSANPEIVSPTVGSVEFTAAASDFDGDPITYDWDFGDGNSDTGATVNHMYGAEGSYTATLTVNDGFDDTVATVDVLVNTPPTIDNGPIANPNPVSLASSAVNFNVTATDANGHDLTYTWDFGDGNGDTGSAPNHTYAGSGDYTATVVVSDGTDSVQGSVDVRVNTPPTIDTGPGASPTLAEIRETVTFGAMATDTNGDNLTYSWDFGDGTSMSGENATHDYASDGTYTVTLTVTDGLDPVQSSLDVTVAKPVGIAKFKGKLNFKKADKDTFLLKGDLELPTDFQPDGKAFQVDLSGAVTDFILDAKGKGSATRPGKDVTFGKAKLKYSKKKGLWTYNVKIKKVSIASDWEDEGLVNGDVAATEVSMRTVIWVDGEPFIKTATFTYSAKAGKSGKVK
jgi:PKD repeat protein